MPRAQSDNIENAKGSLADFVTSSSMVSESLSHRHHYNYNNNHHHHHHHNHHHHHH